MAKFCDGRLTASGTDLPAFLWDAYNSEDIEEGLLKGFFLLRVK